MAVNISTRSMDAKNACENAAIYSRLGFMEPSEGLPVAWDVFSPVFEPSLSRISIGKMAQTDRQTNKQTDTYNHYTSLSLTYAGGTNVKKCRDVNVYVHV